MITKDEVEQKGAEFAIHPANVERDYVFGWLLASLYNGSALKDILILKGGNCFRKAYFPNTRFSRDLDFSTQSVLSEEFLGAELNKICDTIQSSTGVVFEKERNRVEQKQRVDRQLKVYDARLYFKDFYGNPDSITISIRLDITEFDRIYLPVQTRYLIHPYSDAPECRTEIKCVALEELLATKLKCLLQRRHLADLYDYVYSIFINRDIEVNRSELVRTFLRKTIFERGPGIVRGLLLDLPLEVFRAVWNKYLVCPKDSLIDFDLALQKFKDSIEELFGGFPASNAELAFYPSGFRNPIMEAGSNLTLLEVVYDGVKRLVEPYSLVYKVRKTDGVGQEYFYVWDRTGGRSSGPGIKSFLHHKISSMRNTEEKFEPRLPVELSKAGELTGKTYFGSPFSTGRKRTRRSSKRKPGIVYIVECSYCGKRFRRSTRDTRMRKHKDTFGNYCYGRRGIQVDEQWFGY
ncbi:nucleotidyl transferase AbiEii/AbiGii toxin family protein [Acidobacteria bacterium AH-259-L09]|nr:nucleotidyl transferase AbiEii/AbiGii toxin family protein [Acidobacteria bacterium AH-259-L09]